MATNYNSRHTGVEIDNAADYSMAVQSKIPNIGTTTPNSGDVLTWYQNAYRPRPPAIPNLTTDDIAFANPSNSSTSMVANQPLTNIVNAVNNKLDKDGDGSQVKTKTSGIIDQIFQLDTFYSLSNILAYLCARQIIPEYIDSTVVSSTNNGTINTVINFPSGRTPKKIYLYFVNLDNSFVIEIKDKNNTTTKFTPIPIPETTVYNSGCAELEYNGYTWICNYFYTSSSTQITGINTIKTERRSIMKTQQLNRQLKSMTLNAGLGTLKGQLRVQVFYN